MVCESIILICAILAALVADSSIVWCVIFALTAVTGFVLIPYEEAWRKIKSRSSYKVGEDRDFI